MSQRTIKSHLKQLVADGLACQPKRGLWRRLKDGETDFDLEIEVDPALSERDCANSATHIRDCTIAQPEDSETKGENNQDSIVQTNIPLFGLHKVHNKQTVLDLGYSRAQLDRMKAEEINAIAADEHGFLAELSKNPEAWGEFDERVLRPGSGNGN
jgi:hypothetical protein